MVDRLRLEFLLSGSLILASINAAMINVVVSSEINFRSSVLRKGAVAVLIVKLEA